MERPLGALEQSQWLYDQIHPLHFAIIAKIRGQFTLAQLQQALTQVQQQHPLLRVRITIDDYGQPHYTEVKHPIPIRQVTRINAEQWQREVEIEMTQSFNWSIAPLARVVLVQSGAEAELIVVYHHAIADGLSGAYLVGDIVRGLVESHGSRQELATALSIEQAYGLPSEKIIQKSPPTYQTAAATRACPQLRTSLLSAEFTQQLKERCRQEQTTVHGAICAAFLCSLQQPNSSSPLRCLSPRNARSHLALPSANALGIYISYGLTTHDLCSDSSVWEVARSVTGQLAQVDLTQYLPAELAHRTSFMNTQPPAPVVAAEIKARSSCDLLVTNLGQLKIEQQHGDLSITELYGPAVMASFDHERIVGVATVGDRLSLTVLVAPEPETAVAITKRVADNFMANSLQLLTESIATVSI